MSPPTPFQPIHTRPLARHAVATAWLSQKDIFLRAHLTGQGQCPCFHRYACFVSPSWTRKTWNTSGRRRPLSSSLLPPLPALANGASMRASLSISIIHLRRVLPASFIHPCRAPSSSMPPLVRVIISLVHKNTCYVSARDARMQNIQ